MNTITHHSAKASHYNKEAKNHDIFNEKNSIEVNRLIEKILKKYHVKTVLDLTCGTGSQVFWLAKQGYQVVGLDINAQMLKIAKNKNQKEKLDIKFMKGDMRTTQLGKFDAVVIIFNSIGHLTKQDFNKAIKNIYNNLTHKGLYIFDIFNLHYLLTNDNITRLTIDGQKKLGNTTVREIQYSTIDRNGILASYDVYHEQVGSQKPKITKAFQTLQVYSAKQLKELLNKHGFKVLQQSSINGSKFHETKTERILTIAQKLQ